MVFEEGRVDMTNVYEVTLRVETDDEGLVNIKVTKVQEIVREDRDNPDE